MIMLGFSCGRVILGVAGLFSEPGHLRAAFCRAMAGLPMLPTFYIKEYIKKITHNHKVHTYIIPIVLEAKKTW